MSTPPDHIGGERSPIASTAPDPNDPPSTHSPILADGAQPAQASGGRRLGRLLSEAAYRARHSADVVFREHERERVRRWRQQNRDKAKAQRAKARSANYHRPFVSVDSEGQTYDGADILYDGVRYPRHETYLWGAASDDGRQPFWLTAGESSGLDKKPLSAVEILDWLLGLPEGFGPAIFTIFSGGYDITQVLKHLPYEKAWEIEKRETYSDQKDERMRVAHSPVLWKGYAISYVKGKSFEVWRLADPEKPYRGNKLHTTAHVRIYDVRLLSVLIQRRRQKHG